jgi:hypothetical protein
MLVRIELGALKTEMALASNFLVMALVSWFAMGIAGRDM